VNGLGLSREGLDSSVTQRADVLLRLGSDMAVENNSGLGSSHQSEKGKGL
ncbi:unnamed protein product, partial [Allacma fusca]